MFRLQDQDGDLPHINRVFVLKHNAHKAAMAFMKKNHEAGEIAISDGVYCTHNTFFRNTPGDAFVEEIIDPDTAEVSETKYHRGIAS